MKVAHSESFETVEWDAINWGGRSGVRELRVLLELAIADLAYK